MRSFFRFLTGRIEKSLIFIFLVVATQCVANGQENPPPSKTVESSTTDGSTTKKESLRAFGQPSGEGTLPPPTIRYLRNKNGELVPIRNDQDFEDFRKFIDDKNNKAAVPPAATITSVDITGVADDDRAVLKVVFTIRLSSADTFIRVPLAFNEALLLEPPTYSGVGEDAPDIEKDPEKGYAWWFQGRGQHRLEATFAVSLKKQLPTRSLIISLPPSPVSRAKITLPYSSVMAKVLPKQTVIDMKPVGDSKTSVEAIGLGTRLDLTWQPNIDVRPNEMTFESQTTIWAQINSDHALVRADQQVKSLQGLFDQFVVRLPTDAKLLKLEETEKFSYKVDPENRQKVTVLLKEKSNSAQLSWTIRLDAKTRSLTIDGFSVDGARKQYGKLGLSIADGLHFSDQRDSTLASINAGEFPPALGPVIRAYQFLNQPFKLTTTFEEVKPFFRVEPKLNLIASAQSLTLDGEFKFSIDRDRLGEITLSWPNHKTEGWTIEAIDEPGVVESYSTDDQMVVRLVKQQTGTFSIHLRARRPLRPGDDQPFSMPRPKLASRLLPATLILANAENVETDLMVRGDTILHLLPSSSPETLPINESRRGTKVTRYRIDSDDQSFALRVIPQKQRIRTESITHVKWQDKKFQFTQRLIYDVSYERLSQMRVTIPAGIDHRRLQFFAHNDVSDQTVELTPEPVQTASGSERQILLKLVEPQLGHFEVQARFSIPFEKQSAFESDKFATIPIIASVDEPFSRTRVQLAQSDWFDAEPLSVETWKPQLNRNELLEWMADGTQSEMPLKLIRSTHSNETGTVSRSLLRFYVDGNGESVVRSQFRVTTRATSILVDLPATAKSPTFFWDQKRLPDREPIEQNSETRRYVVLLPDKQDSVGTSEHLLTIDYRDQMGIALGWSDGIQLRSPQFPNCSWDQVYWQVILPSDQHLFTYPASASPMFRWQRTGAVWSRVSDPTSDRLHQWVTEGVIELPAPANTLLSANEGNLYTFLQFNSPRPLKFQTLSSSIVLLLGAGFSLVVGFVMLRIVVLQHVLTLLLVTLAFAVVGLWYSAPLGLLLQPMIAGLLLPIAAVLLENAIRRRYDTSALTFGRHGEFPPMQAFGGSHYVVRQTDPNDATLHRPAARDSAISLPVESGSGVS